jgi:hypothetical protein
MTKTESIALARRAYAIVESVAERHAEAAKAAALEGERRHRKGGDFRRYHPGAASAETCAEMFVVKFIAQYLCTEAIPNISAVLYLRPDAVICAGIVAMDDLRLKLYEGFRAENVDVYAVAALDYTALVGKVKAA